MNGQDLLKYSFSNAGILHCFLWDLWTLRRKQDDAFGGIFWFKEVPCALIMFVGVVVGTRSYEKNTCIWVDDGSEVMEARWAHHPVTRIVESKGKDGKISEKNEIKTMEPPGEVPQIGATVKVLASLESAGRQGRDQPVNIRIKEIEACGSMEETFHWDRVIQLHKTKYSQPFVLSEASHLYQPTISEPPTPQKPSTPYNEEQSPIRPTPRAAYTRHTPAPSASPESVRSCTAQETSCAATSRHIPRLRHPTRLKSSQLNLETLQMYVIYYMTCMAQGNRASMPRDDPTPTKSRPFQSSPRLKWCGGSSNHEDKLGSEGTVGFGLGYLMRVPELQNLALRIIKAERKLAEKRKILQERENRNNAGSVDDSLRPKKQTRPGSLKKDLKRLFERIISNLFHNGAIVIEEGKSRRWDDGETLLVNSLQLWKLKTGEIQTQCGESTLGTIPDISLASTGAEDELHLSDVDDTEDCYIPVTQHLLREPILLAINRATYRQKRELRQGAAKHQGATEQDILGQLRSMDSRWDHISNILATLQQLEEEDEIWEASRGVWAAH